MGLLVLGLGITIARRREAARRVDMRNILVDKRSKKYGLVKASREILCYPFVDDLHEDMDEKRICFVASSFSSPCAGCGWYSRYCNLAGVALWG